MQRIDRNRKEGERVDWKRIGEEMSKREVAEKWEWGGREVDGVGEGGEKMHSPHKGIDAPVCLHFLMWVGRGSGGACVRDNIVLSWP